VSTKIRYHGLDFARSALLLLGVFYHTALIFRGDNTWRVTSEFSSNFLFWLTDFTTSFRMEGFYLVSGFFLFLAYEQNKSNILIQRIQRIFIPMMFMAFTFNQYLMHASYNYNYTDNFKYYIILGQWLEHLWFLGNLIGYFFFGRLFSLLLLARKSKPRLNLKIVLTIAPISSLLLVPVTEFFYYPVYFFITIDSFFIIFLIFL
jgi:fucose 4-O-acetylase-like acetyltransferase